MAASCSGGAVFVFEVGEVLAVVLAEVVQVQDAAFWPDEPRWWAQVGEEETC